MATGSTLGHIALWNLEEKKLQSQMRHAHRETIAGMAFLQSEPVMITNSSDNHIKVGFKKFSGPKFIKPC